MARKLKEILEERKVKAQEYRTIIDSIEKEKRSANKEEDERLDKLDVELESLEKEEKRAMRLEAEEKRQADIDNLERKSQGLGGTEDEKEARAAFIQYLRGGTSSLTPEQRSALKFENRAGTGQVTGASDKGGYLVAKSLSDKIIVALKSKGGFLAEVNIMATSKGGEILVPLLNDTDSEATIVGEGVASDKGDKTFGSTSLKSYTYRTPIIPVSLELLEDSEFDIEGMIADAIANSIYRAIIKHITVGDGVGKPQGILVGATKGVDAASTALTFDNLIDLEVSVDEDYLLNAKFMFNRKTLGLIKKMKDSTGQYLWQPRVDTNTPATIMGYPYVTNPYMPDVAAGAKSIVFGDLKQYTVRQVNSVRLIRLSERLIDELNIGFIGYGRFDGKLMDAGTHPVKYLQHANS